MRLPAPESAAQIVATGVTRMGEKEYPALPAALQVAPQLRPLAQQRPNLGIVRPRQFARRAATIPTRLELEMLADFVCYKPRR
jgi:hypothetical protein